MAISAIIRERFVAAFELYAELASRSPGGSLALKLPGIASNALGDQLWCVVGARESFGGAIRSGAWSGFSCSLQRQETRAGDAVIAALSRSAEDLLVAIGDSACTTTTRAQIRCIAAGEGSQRIRAADSANSTACAPSGRDRRCASSSDRCSVRDRVSTAIASASIRSRARPASRPGQGVGGLVVAETAIRASEIAAGTSAGVNDRDLRLATCPVGSGGGERSPRCRSAGLAARLTYRRWLHQRRCHDRDGHSRLPVAARTGL